MLNILLKLLAYEVFERIHRPSGGKVNGERDSCALFEEGTVECFAFNNVLGRQLERFP